MRKINLVKCWSSSIQLCSLNLQTQKHFQQTKADLNYICFASFPQRSYFHTWSYCLCFSIFSFEVEVALGAQWKKLQQVKTPDTDPPAQENTRRQCSSCGTGLANLMQYSLNCVILWQRIAAACNFFHGIQFFLHDMQFCIYPSYSDM